MSAVMFAPNYIMIYGTALFSDTLIAGYIPMTSSTRPSIYDRC